MKNIGDSSSYRFVDYVANRAVRSLSRIVGVRNITRPFWSRWRASTIGDETLMNFLSEIHSIDDWPVASMKLVEREERSLETITDRDARIAAMRRLSYLCHLAQWGCMDTSETRASAYRKSRDYYVEAEALAHGDRYRRFSIPWGDAVCWANLHLPDDVENSALLIICHGMDDTKEEHLASELALRDRGFAVIGVDGPGQGESYFEEKLFWPANFSDIVGRAVDACSALVGIEYEHVGIIGISWGGMWALKAAAVDPRVAAVYDLGGPVDSERFDKLPFFLKTRFCQVLGVSGPDDLGEAKTAFCLRDEESLNRINCAVKIVHGGKDPLVPFCDKQWLCEQLLALRPDADISIHMYPEGDHCCTAHIDEIRVDAAEFFARTVPKSRRRVPALCANS
jgi:pimeloyl-ACP methyl ester carboxylesterase